MVIEAQGSDSKYASEIRRYSWDSASDLVGDECASSVLVEVVDSNGQDVTPDCIVSGTLTLTQETVVGADFKAGAPGMVYYMKLQVTTDEGHVYGKYWQIRVKEG